MEWPSFYHPLFKITIFSYSEHSPQAIFHIFAQSPIYEGEYPEPDMLQRRRNILLALFFLILILAQIWLFYNLFSAGETESFMEPLKKTKAK